MCWVCLRSLIEELSNEGELVWTEEIRKASCFSILLRSRIRESHRSSQGLSQFVPQTSELDGVIFGDQACDRQSSRVSVPVKDHNINDAIVSR